MIIQGRIGSRKMQRDPRITLGREKRMWDNKESKNERDHQRNELQNVGVMGLIPSKSLRL